MMKRLYWLGLGLAATASAQANDFPTVGRVEYVLECMYRHEGKQEYLYKCSCAIDEIAKQLKYDDYVSASMTVRYRDMGGERMGAFRDPDNLKADARKYLAVQAKAAEACGLPPEKR
ncbi:MAG: hypothetical protein WCA12_05230 [Burkholderiales bacterium]